MTPSLLYERDSIKPEWQGNINSYQVSLRISESGSPYATTTELVRNGDQINPSGVEDANHGRGLERIYSGLNIWRATKLRRLVESSSRYVERGSVSLRNLVKFIDALVLTPGSLDDGIELAVVEDHYFLNDKAWKKKPSVLAESGDRYERQMSHALPLWYRTLNAR